LAYNLIFVSGAKDQNMRFVAKINHNVILVK
jgi:hypothetical protein